MADSNPVAVPDSDLPSLFREADSASLVAQKTYLRFVGLNLGAMVLVPILNGVGWKGIVPALLLLGAAITLWLTQRAYQKTWFGGRAMAESVKSLAWQYMMGSPPFDAPDARGADARFVSDLREVLHEGGTVASALGSAAPAAEITDTMRSVRARTPEQRKQLYMAGRLEDQRRWYAARAIHHRRYARGLLGAVALLQFFGAICAFLQGRIATSVAENFPDLAAQLGDAAGMEHIAIGAVFSALATALLSWLQSRQHQELASAYGMATHELGLALAGAQSWPTEKLGELVDEAERMISREHTMWVARRNTPGR